MRKKISIFLALVLLLSFFVPLTAHAEGEGNIDNGGGGMGSGSDVNFWNVGDEAVRITVVRVSDRLPVTSPVDFTNKTPPSTIIHFGKVSKLQYNGGASLSVKMNGYTYINPVQPIPRIISSGSGQASIEEIKQYFCSEYTLMRIADVTGMNYNILISGGYKLLLEPIAYV